MAVEYVEISPNKFTNFLLQIIGKKLHVRNTDLIKEKSIVSGSNKSNGVQVEVNGSYGPDLKLWRDTKGDHQDQNYDMAFDAVTQIEVAAAYPKELTPREYEIIQFGHPDVPEGLQELKAAKIKLLYLRGLSPRQAEGEINEKGFKKSTISKYYKLFRITAPIG